MRRTIVILSGGMDSATLLWKLKADGHRIKALGINYGQRHMKELRYADKLATLAGLRSSEFRVADLTTLRPFLAGSSQTDRTIEVPEGHYTAESMKATVVPNRNMIMLATATAWAISSDFDSVAYAAHAGDHAIYPDCRPEFAMMMAQAIKLADWREITLLDPFIHMTKAEICALGGSLGVPFEVTWSCYKGGALHCGKCGTCVERREAFQLAGVPDPTDYDLVPA